VGENTKRDSTSACFSLKDLRMSEAMKLIVDGYIRLKDRKRLEALRENWGQMRSRLEESSKGGFEVSPSMKQFDKEILAIEQGLRALDNPAADVSQS
jgi:hypothetical protein